MGFMIRRNRKCDFCGSKEATKQIAVSDVRSRSVCDTCWTANRVVPYLYLITLEAFTIPPKRPAARAPTVARYLIS